MKFIAKEGTPTYDKIAAVMDRMKECTNAARKLNKAQGWDPNIYVGHGCMAGGISGVHFPEAPKDWRHIGTTNGMRFYWPIKGRKSTREVLEQLKSLPTVGRHEFNQTIGSDNAWSHFGLISRPGFFLLDVPDTMEVDAADLEEITVKQYNEYKASQPAQ